MASSTSVSTTSSVQIDGKTVQVTEGNGTVQVTSINTQVASNPAFVGQSDQAQAARLYQAAFHRLPDKVGLDFWTNALQQGATLEQIATDFLLTSEGTATFGAANTKAFVTALYQNVLGRGPDAIGAAFWDNAIDSGLLTRGAVLASFSQSSEFRTLV
jgi:hypothetical protein